MNLENLRYAPKMFRFLNGGHFICASSTSEEQKLWYEALDGGWEEYRDAWLATTGLELSRGDGYYYFRRNFLPDGKGVDKMASDYKEFCTVLDLVYQIDPSFDIGRTVTKSWALSGLDRSPAAQELCKTLFNTQTKDEWADSIIDRLLKMEIVDMYLDDTLNEYRYPVKESFDYYRTFIDTIRFVSVEDEKSIQGDDEEDVEVNLFSPAPEDGAPLTQ